MKIKASVLFLLLSVASCRQDHGFRPAEISGIYPHLANYNNEGECGTGALVPWADRLWVLSYGPHLPFGSSDKLYEIKPDLRKVVRPESIGGTPANRMIHRESSQLFIGPYIIDSIRNIRVLSFDSLPGRLTGNASHLTEPAEKMYYATMEEGFYEVDVKSLRTTVLYEDGNLKSSKGEDVSANQATALLAGAHGKGVYSGQGVVVYSNNGEQGPEALKRFDIPSGSLSEWDGKTWRLIRRNQFVEVTGPGGIYGNGHPATDPIWVTGWDHKSVIAGVRDHEKGWSFYRLPIASHSYDGAHGWNTEWPRIRDVGTPGAPYYLMTMHGMFWHFPETFSAGNTAGIRPLSAYLKVIGDFARWNDRLVFGCDDAAKNEFLNKRTIKGNIAGSGQSNSNLWFTSPGLPGSLGPDNAGGAVWISEDVKAGAPSEPFLFAGWDIRSAWIRNEGNKAVLFTFESDEAGNNTWKVTKNIKAEAGASVNLVFDAAEAGEWIRVKTNRDTRTTVYFTYAREDDRVTQPATIFTGLADVTSRENISGLLWGLGDNRRKLGVLAGTVTGKAFDESGYYELDSLMRLVRKDDPQTASYIRDKVAIPRNGFTIDEASVLIVDDGGRRWRLPKGNMAYDSLTTNGLLRVCREVVTERDLLNLEGTFYELPAENADGFAKIRPVASHHFRIHDYASYRGMLVMTGIDVAAGKNNPHVIVSDDGKAAVWAGVIDDLWKAGKPAGEGGPWKNSKVTAGIASDPYLIAFYDERALTISHDSESPVTFTVEADPSGNGTWMKYTSLTVMPGKNLNYNFPASFQARWVRFSPDRDCLATAWLEYR